MTAGQKDDLLRGGGLIFLAACSYAVMGTLVKFGKHIPDEQLVFTRNSICLLLLLPWILLPKPKPLRTQVLPTQVLRAVAGLLNMYTFFLSIRYIILADAMVLNNTMPLFIPLVMLVWKGKKIPLKLIPGLIIGFLGIIFVLRPSPAIFQPAALLALASGIFMSVSMAGVRELGKFEPVYRILFYYFFISTLLSAIPLIWTWQNQNFLAWLILIGVGIFAATYQFFLTQGFQYAPAEKISPFIYFAVILSGMFDWIFWGVVPGILSYIGVILVIIGAVYCIKVEVR